MGREIRELANELAADLRLIASGEEEAGTLTEQAGEASIIGALDEETLAGARVVFLAGTPESVEKAVQAARGAALIDMTYALEDAPGASLRAPMVEPSSYTPAAGAQVIAHPAAIAIALLLGRLHAAYPVRRAVIHVFEPASERGARGVDELHQQSVNLFAFRALPKNVYGEQVGFNLLARYGEEAPAPLEEIEERIERHLATLLSRAGNTPMPSLRLIQVPVFHGHCFSAWIEFEKNPGAATLEETIESDNIEVRAAGDAAPTAVGAAGRNGVSVGAIAVDRNHPQACWFWMVADNLRISAQNALAVASEFL
ncbi:MAG: Asd/ArgC dimerization domain-containing protein [Bryobacteraceae bacterium]